MLTPKQILAEITLLKAVRDGGEKRKYVCPVTVQFRIRQFYAKYERQLGVSTNSCRMVLLKATK